MSTWFLPEATWSLDDIMDVMKEIFRELRKSRMISKVAGYSPDFLEAIGKKNTLKFSVMSKLSTEVRNRARLKPSLVRRTYPRG